MSTPYSAEQMELLSKLMPRIMRALRKHSHALYRRLDEGHCWHLPACLPGEECIGGEPSESEKAAMQDDAEAGGGDDAKRGAAEEADARGRWEAEGGDDQC